MEVLSHFDGGVARPFDVSGDEITFDLEGGSTCHVLMRGCPSEIGVRLLLDERPGRFFRHQGLFYSHDGRRYVQTPVAARADDGSYTFRVPTRDGRVWVSTRVPYGRDHFDRLLAECIGASDLHVRVLGSGGRIVPVFEFGEENSGKTVHWFIAGEDAWETAGTWVADAMVRTLVSDRVLSGRLLSRSTVRVVPLASPYSTTQPASSYATLEGQNIYAAATWTHDQPPSEIALLREAVLHTTRTGRLGLLLTIHSWNGSYDTSTMEFIRTAGERELTGDRLAWARTTLETLMTGVPLGRTHVSEKIWHPGLARDYMLAEHDVISYRIEITTAGQDCRAFTETGRRLLQNTAAVEDWSRTYP